MSEHTPLEAPAFTALGTARDRVALPATPFDGVVHAPAMHQAVKSYLANQRQGTAYTKTRGLVTGGNQKPWKQKGTGRARQGSTRAPHWPGGGTVFGPHGDRNYSERLPRQVRALARRSALNARAMNGALLLVDRFAYEKPRTALVLAALERMGIADRKVLILTDGVKQAVYLSARNLPNVRVLPYSDASTYDILWSDAVVLEASAIGQDLSPLAERGDAPKPSRKRAASRAEASEDAAVAAAAPATAAKRTVKKRAAGAAGAAGAAVKAAPAAAKKSAAAKKTVAKKAAPKKKEK